MSKTVIDKLAFIYLKGKKVLVALSHGKDTWYLPGGKRDFGESDQEALMREVKEELNVDLLIDTIKYYGVFEAQAHGKPEGTMVQMTCYSADFSGILSPTSEIEKIDFFSYSQKELTSLVNHQIFDDLHNRGLLK